MDPPRQPSSRIVVRVSIIAVMLFLAPTALVWLGSGEAEKAIAVGKVPRAERWIAAVATLTGYPLVPSRAKGRAEGARCQLAMAQGLEEEAMGHFLREIEWLSGRDLTSGGAAPLSPGARLPFSKFRKGSDAWIEGYRDWTESAPARPPEFGYDFLPPERRAPPPPRKAAEEPFPSAFVRAFDESIADTRSALRDAYSIAVRGEADPERGRYLAENREILDLARAVADEAEHRDLDLDALAPSSDAFRLLALEFVEAAAAGDESAALDAFRRCGRLLGRFEAAPSVTNLLALIALRSGWHGVLETALEQDPLSPAARQGLLDLLTLFAFDPEYPSRCFRHGYADQRDLLAATYLGGSWEAASPAGKRLYARQMELAFERYRRWAKALSPGTPPEDAAAIEADLSRADGYEAGLLAQRQAFADTFYGSRELTMRDGRRFAQAVDECVVALADRVATFRLGRLGDTLRKLREDEAGLVERLRN